MNYNAKLGFYNEKAKCLAGKILTIRVIIANFAGYNECAS